MVNLDGALNPSSGEAGIGVIIRDDQGGVLLSSWQYIRQEGNAEEVEASACREGLALASG